MAVLPDDDCRANYFETVVTNQRLGLHFLFNERQEMSYHHKSGAQKRREKLMRTEGVLNEEDLLEIEEEPEEVPRSEPDIDAAGCSGWTEGPETPDAEALVVVAGADIGIFIKGEVRCPRGKK